MTKKMDLRKKIMMERNKYSKMFRIYFDDFSNGAPVNFYLYSNEYHIGVPVTIIKEKTTTPQHIENWILRTVTRTDFKDYVVKDHRYKLDFSQFGYDFYKALFNFILSKDKINTSWLSPIQDMIIQKKKNIDRFQIKKPIEKYKFAFEGNVINKAMKNAVKDHLVAGVGNEPGWYINGQPPQQNWLDGVDQELKAIFYQNPVAFPDGVVNEINENLPY